MTKTEGANKARVAWTIAWVLSVALAFLLGHQMGEGKRLDVTAQPQTPATATPAPEQPAPTPDPQTLEILKNLPRREAGDPLAKGAVDAKVVMTEWSDYRCPYCARWATQTLPQLQRYVDDGTLRIEYRDLAVFGEDSVATAVAARAAGQQGRFWEYYETVFAAGGEGEHPDHSQPELIEFARTAGVPDLAAFEAALADPALRHEVMSDTQEANQFGIRGTPFFVINTTVIDGARPTENFIAAIEKHAKE